MKSLRAVGTGALLIAAVACGAAPNGPPEIVLDRSVCEHCQMLVSELRFAAAYRPAGGGDMKVFDDLSCFAESLNNEADAEAADVWIRDYMAERWLEPSEVFVVRSAAIPTPMGGGMVAVRGAGAAERLAVRTDDARIMTFRELIAER